MAQTMRRTVRRLGWLQHQLRQLASQQLLQCPRLEQQPGVRLRARSRCQHLLPLAPH